MSKALLRYHVGMGCLRLFLALSVLASHYWFWRINFWMGAYIAVTAFFIISGFYMSLVLDTKYTGRRGLLTFYSNRALRLFPVYWIVLLLTALGNHFGVFGDTPPTVFQMSNPIDAIDRLISIFSNAFLLPSAIGVAYDLLVRHGITWGPWDVLIAGQMFTVGIEISFYLLAPLVMLLSPRWLIVTFLAALGLHILPTLLRLPFRPWQYDFFPCMLVFFIAGRLSYLLYLRSLTWRYSVPWGWLALPIIGVYCCFGGLTTTVQPNAIILLIALALLIPFLFRASKESTVDRWLGDLSYPIYVCQFMVIAWAERSRIEDVSVRHQIAWAAVVGISILLLITVDRPIELLGQRRAIKSAKPRSALHSPIRPAASLPPARVRAQSFGTLRQAQHRLDCGEQRG